MKIVSTNRELQELLAEDRKAGTALGFVPTMGALHEGHLSLARCSRRDNRKTLMSIYVNPTQFGPREDFQAYPRNLEEDARRAQSAGVDVIYAPSTEQIYPEGYSTYVEETLRSKDLCGVQRPGHFRGVCTVVLKLLHLVRPHRMYLGQKDAQQFRVIEKMVFDFALPVQVVACPIVRETDGLAMSSRNAYLSPSERKIAPRFHEALQAAHAAWGEGEADPRKLLGISRNHLGRFPDLCVEYLEIRRWKDLAPVQSITEDCILLGAVRLGTTRLIDNLLLTLP